MHHVPRPGQPPLPEEARVGVGGEVWDSFIFGRAARGAGFRSKGGKVLGRGFKPQGRRRF